LLESNEAPSSEVAVCNDAPVGYVQQIVVPGTMFTTLGVKV